MTERSDQIRRNAASCVFERSCREECSAGQLAAAVSDI